MGIDDCIKKYQKFYFEETTQIYFKIKRNKCLEKAYDQIKHKQSFYLSNRNDEFLDCPNLLCVFYGKDLLG